MSDDSKSLQHNKRMRVRAVRLQVEFASAELEQLITEEPTGEVRNDMTDGNILLHGARSRLKLIGESI